MGVDLQVGLSLLDGVDDLLEGLIGLEHRLGLIQGSVDVGLLDRHVVLFGSLVVEILVDVVVNDLFAHGLGGVAVGDHPLAPRLIGLQRAGGAEVGDVVGVEYQEMNKRKMQMILYGFPVLSVIAGAVFGNSIAVFFDIDKTMPVMLGVVIWLLVSVNYARIFKRDAVREGVQPVVIEIEAPDPIVFDDTEDENEKK